MEYRVVKASGLLSQRSEWDNHLRSLQSEVQEHNGAIMSLDLKVHRLLEWKVPGKWWVYEDYKQGRLLRFFPASGRPRGIKVIGSMVVEEVKAQ